MPLVAAAVIGAGATVYASSKASKAAKKATAATTAANDRAMDLQEQQYENLAPWREVGLGALQQLARVHGITVPGTVGTEIGAPSATGFNAQAYLTANPDISEAAKARGVDPLTFAAQHYETTGRNEIAAGSRNPLPPANDDPAADPRFADFFESPDYKYRVEQGTRAITGNRAARGLLDAGTTGQGLINYGQKAASQEFGNWYNRIANLAGVGQSATNQQGQVVDAQGRIVQDQGENLASSYATQGGIQAGMINTVGNTVAGLIANRSGNPGISGGAVTPYNPQTVMDAVRTPPIAANTPGLLTPNPTYNLRGAVV